MAKYISFDQAALLSSAWRWSQQSGASISCQILYVKRTGSDAFGYAQREQLLESILKTATSPGCSDLLQGCLLMLLTEQAPELFRTSYQAEKSLSQLISLLTRCVPNTRAWCNVAHTCTSLILYLNKSLPVTCRSLLPALRHHLHSRQSATSRRCLLQLSWIASDDESGQCFCPMLIPDLYSSRPYSALSSLHRLVSSKCIEFHHVNVQRSVLELHQSRLSPVYTLMAYIVLDRDAADQNDSFYSDLEASASDVTSPATIRWLFVSWMSTRRFRDFLAPSPFDDSPYIQARKLESLLCFYDETCSGSVRDLLTSLSESIPSSSIWSCFSRVQLDESLLKTLSLQVLLQLTKKSDCIPSSMSYLIVRLLQTENLISELPISDFFVILLAAPRMNFADVLSILRLCQIALPLSMESFELGHKFISAVSALSRYNSEDTWALLSEVERRHPHIHIRDRVRMLLDYSPNFSSRQAEVDNSADDSEQHTPREEIDLP